jgi:hypothetical protein
VKPIVKTIAMTAKTLFIEPSTIYKRYGHILRGHRRMITIREEQMEAEMSAIID